MIETKNTSGKPANCQPAGLSRGEMIPQNVSIKCVQEYEKASKPKTLAGSLAPAIMQGSREGRYELALAVERTDTFGGL